MRMTQLKTIADIQTGPFGSQLHKEDYVETGTPIVTVEHLGNRVFTEQNLPRVSDSDKARLIKYTLSSGDIVFSRVGSVDRCSYVDKSHDGWMFSGRCLRVRPTELVDSLYLYYYFCLEETKQFVRNIAVGATMPSINTKLLGEVEIALPDLNNQKRIAAVLSSLDDKIENNQKLNDNLEQQAQSYFQELFVDNASPEWTTGTISDLGTVVGGSTPSKAKPEYYTESGIAWITPKDLSINKSKFVSHGENDITELGLKNSSAVIMPEGTVLFSSRAPIGYIAIAAGEVTTNQGFKSVVPKPEIGIMALLYKEKCRDFMNNTTIDIVNSMLESPDIHHIFPEAYCEKLGIKRERYNSIINKTPILPATNRSIGGNAPSEYLGAILKKVDGLTENELQARVESHFINYAELKADDFNGYFIDRAKSLLNLIEKAMNKPVTDRDAENTLDQFGASLA